MKHTHTQLALSTIYKCDYLNHNLHDLIREMEIFSSLLLRTPLADLLHILEYENPILHITAACNSDF